MNISETELPSNRNFGFFLSFVFSVAAAYFFYAANITWAYVSVTAALLFLVVTLIKSDTLQLLNKLWMRFGLLLGMIVSPIVLGIIFYGLITPYSLVMKIFGRDELRLKIKRSETNWKARSQALPQTDFTQQF
jgi:hypothetical protein